MIGLPFISELFKNVLERSRGIQGRFFYLAAKGAELDASDFDQVIKDQFDRPNEKPYPAAFMLPPISEGIFTDPKGEWEKYSIRIFFLATQFTDGNNEIRDPNEATGTSTHQIIYDQHDMGRCARNFILVLDMVMRDRVRMLIRDKIRLSTDPKRIIPVSYVSASQLAGVQIDFDIAVMNACSLEDYISEDVAAIAIPDLDPHPEHNL